MRIRTRITLTRRQDRCLRAVCRHSLPGINHREPIQPLVLCAAAAQLRAQHRYGAWAVELALPDVNPTDRAIALPLDARPDVEGHDESPIVGEAAAPEPTVVRREDRGLPQTRQYAGPPLAGPEPFPEPTDASTESSATPGTARS